MQEAGQHGTGQGVVVVKDPGPVFVELVERVNRLVIQMPNSRQEQEYENLRVRCCSLRYASGLDIHRRHPGPANDFAPVGCGVTGIHFLVRNLNSLHHASRLDVPHNGFARAKGVNGTASNEPKTVIHRSDSSDLLHCSHRAERWCHRQPRGMTGHLG